MTQQSMNADDPHRLPDILAADEAQPGLGRQIVNGVGGLMVLLITGIVLVLLVLWKSP